MSAPVPRECGAKNGAGTERGKNRAENGVIHSPGIELRMDVIDEDARFAAPRGKWKKGKPRCGLRHGTKRLASCRHFDS
jgi:hypothetical protein